MEKSNVSSRIDAGQTLIKRTDKISKLLGIDVQNFQWT